jgi:hypothetical protein
MRFIVILILLILPTSAFAQTDTVPASVRILTGTAAEALLDPCTRRAPVYVDSLWLPDSATVWMLLSGLPARLRDAKPDEVREYPGPLGMYDAAVTGFYRRGATWLYAAFADTSARRPTGEPAFGWCDGGWRFFGVQYDVAAGALQDPVRNDVSFLLTSRDSLAAERLLVLAERQAALADSAYTILRAAYEARGLPPPHGPGHLYLSVLETLSAAAGQDHLNLEADLRVIEVMLIIGEESDGCIGFEHRDGAAQLLEHLRRKAEERDDERILARVADISRRLDSLPARCP